MIRNLPKTSDNSLFFSQERLWLYEVSLYLFSLLRGLGEGSVLFANPLGHATVYDVASKSVTAIPATNFPKPADSISLSMT